MPLHLLANAVYGALFAWTFRQSPDLRRTLFCWQLLGLGLFQALVVTPAVTYMLRFAPEWALVYSIDPQVHPRIDGLIGWLTGPMVLGHFAVAGLGFAGARHALLARRPLWALVPMGCAGLAWLLSLIVYRHALLYVGDFDAVAEGRAPSLLRVPPGIVAALAYLAAAAYLAWLRRRFAHEDFSFI